MTDRSSAPKSRPTKTSAELEALIEQLRRQRWTAPRIAGELNMATSTVCAVLKRIGLNRLWRLEPPEPPNRYCRRHPGELIHIDIKKLGKFDRAGHRALGRGAGRGNRGIGWEFCHVAIDDTSRLAYVEILDDEKASTCVAFLRRAIGYFAAHGVTVERVMTDNGTGYRSHAHRAAIAELKIKHLRTQPLPAPHQRESGTLHPDPATRMGLRHRLRQQLAPPPRPSPLAELLQQPTTPQRPQPQDARQPNHR
jgi:hypothetical protein